MPPRRFANPKRTIPRALVIGVLDRHGELHRAQRRVLPRPARRRRSPTRRASRPMRPTPCLGRGGAAAMSAIVVVSTFGALNGVILAGPRAYLAMARDGLLVAWAGGDPPALSHAASRARCCKARGRSCSCPRAPTARSSRASSTPSGSSSRSWRWGSCACAGGATYAPAYRVWGYPVGADRVHPLARRTSSSISW